MTSILLHGFVDTPYLKNDLSLLFWIIIAVSVAREHDFDRSKNFHRLH
ncbi:MAG: hypothetical protein UW39_C0007G0011 [Parcubacteria group bacterium GW2011_GWC2_44_17]|nr:MAG: hypothetical protein UW39_C0007G0011 [Parcubacteria group bacterium GW2011_GWC2_44_17]